MGASTGRYGAPRYENECFGGRGEFPGLFCRYVSAGPGFLNRNEYGWAGPTRNKYVWAGRLGRRLGENVAER